MPFRSAQQRKFMEAIAHNPDFAKKANVQQSVGKEFVEASAPKTSIPTTETYRPVENRTENTPYRRFEKLKSYLKGLGN